MLSHLAPTHSTRRRRAIVVAVLAGASCGIGVAVAATTTTVIPLAGTTYTFTTAFAPDGTTAYTTAEGTNAVSVIDTSSHQVVATIPGVAQMDTPRGIAVTDDRVLVVSSQLNKLGVIDRSTNTYTSFVPIPAANASARNDANWLVLDNSGTRAYVLAQSAAGSATGSVTAFDAQGLQVTGTATGINGANGIALSPDGTRIYVSSVSGAIVVIDSATMATIDTINLGGRLNAVAADPRGGHLYVLSQSPDRLVVVDLTTRSAVASISANASFEFNNMVISPDGHHVYYTANYTWTATQVDTEDPTNPVEVQSTPVDRAYGVGIGRSGAAIYAASNTNPGKVTAFDTDVPGTSTGGSATAGVGSATLTWLPPGSDGGAPITRYVVTSVEDPAQSCTTEATLPAPPPTTCTISGLTAGRAYTFTVVAHNGAGNGPTSGPLGPVAPTAPTSASTPAAASTTPAASQAEAATRPALSVRLLPSRRALRAGQGMRLGVRTINGGAASMAQARMRGQTAIATAAGVSTCVRVPANLVITRMPAGSLRSGRLVCWRLGNLQAGQQRTKVLTVRAAAVRSVSRTVVATARSAQGTGAVASATGKAAVRISPRTPRIAVTG